MNTSGDPSVSRSRFVAWACAIGCWYIGLGIIGVAFGLIPTSPRNVLAPGWVLACAGVTFLVGGFAPLAGSRGASPVLSNVIGAGVLVPLTLVAHWVAFGSGPRQFSGSMNFGPTSTSHVITEKSGRFVFGAGAITLDVLIIAVCVRAVRRSRGLDSKVS